MKKFSCYSLALARISIGFIFLWAFFDKLFGLGFTTCRNTTTNVVTTMCDAAWLNGGSPTTGFLKFATQGPLADMYKSLAGNALIDWLFMVGLAGIGLGLVFGIARKLSGYSGFLLMIMMYAAVLPPEHHPFLDEHIVYALLLLYFANATDQKLSLHKWFSKTPLGKIFI